MTAATDFLQTLLNQPDPFTFPGCIAAALIFLILLKAVARTLKLAKQTLKFGRTFFPKLSIGFAVKVCIMAGFLYICKDSAHDYLQYVETRWLNPVDTSGAFNRYSSDHLTAIYETELRRHVDDYEFRIIQDSVRAMCKQFGCDSSAIYECMLPECGMNPFVIRPDGIAAGPIQFTRRGCEGLPFTLDHIKKWCKDRNARALMSATRQYLVSRSHNRHMKTGTDIYVCVFAPEHLGCAADKVFYSSGDAYEKNKGIDGWKIESGKIVRSPSAVDHRITAGELDLWMQYKKIQLIKRSNKI